MNCDVKKYRYDGVSAFSVFYFVVLSDYILFISFTKNKYCTYMDIDIMSFPSQLKIETVSVNGDPVLSDISCCNLLDNKKITIGRGSGNHLILDDPSRVISRLQASLSLKDSFSADIVNLSSSTSMFINAEEMLPGGESVLRVNDSLMIGSYTLKLSAYDQENSGNDYECSREDGSHHQNNNSSYIPLDANFLSGGESVKSARDSTQLLLDKLMVQSNPQDAALLVSSDDISSLLQEKKQTASFDVDHSLEAKSLFVTPHPQLETHKEPMSLAEVNSIKSASSMPTEVDPSQKTNMDCRLAFSRALQMDINKVPEFTPEFFEQLGSVLLHLTAGTINMMHGRAQIKHEMRADVTIIASSGNNPLKFAPDAQSALTHLLGDPMPGFLPAKDAIDDAIDDLLAHQLGLVSGARAAVYEVIKNFSPDKIQKYFTVKNIVDSFIPMAKKSRLWELYETHYSEVAGIAREDFELRFQYAFAQAYEREIDKMCTERELI